MPILSLNRARFDEDFDRIGTEFHRWLRDASAMVGLTGSDDFFRFIDRDFDFYAKQYLRLIPTDADPVNCGGCGVACNRDETCVSSVCTKVDVCQ